MWTFIVNLYNHFDLTGLLDSYHTICFYGGGAKVAQHDGIKQYVFRLVVPKGGFFLFPSAGHSPVSVTHWRGKEATRARDIRRAIQHRVTREVLEKFSGEMAAEDQREEEEAVERCDAEIRAVCERYAGEKALRVARRARTDPLLDGLMRFVMYTCRRA